MILIYVAYLSFPSPLKIRRQKNIIYLLEGAPPVSHRRCHHVGCLWYRIY